MTLRYFTIFHMLSVSRLLLNCQLNISPEHHQIHLKDVQRVLPPMSQHEFSRTLFFIASTRQLHVPTSVLAVPSQYPRKFCFIFFDCIEYIIRVNENGSKLRSSSRLYHIPAYTKAATKHFLNIGMLGGFQGRPAVVGDIFSRLAGATGSLTLLQRIWQQTMYLPPEATQIQVLARAALLTSTAFAAITVCAVAANAQTRARVSEKFAATFK